MPTGGLEVIDHTLNRKTSRTRSSGSTTQVPLLVVDNEDQPNRNHGDSAYSPPVYDSSSGSITSPELGSRPAPASNTSASEGENLEVPQQKPTRKNSFGFATSHGRRKSNTALDRDEELTPQQSDSAPSATPSKREIGSSTATPPPSKRSQTSNESAKNTNNPTTVHSSTPYTKMEDPTKQPLMASGRKKQSGLNGQSPNLQAQNTRGSYGGSPRNSRRNNDPSDPSPSRSGAAHQPPRPSLFQRFRTTASQFIDIVRNKSKKQLRSHDELTMSPFQKFIHYGRFPCKLVLSTFIVILITVLIFTFELQNSLNDENERKQLIELFMDAVDVDGASGRREPGDDYTFVPTLFLSTQDSVLAAMANVGQLYYNITRESLCDLDFFFNDDFEDYPRNVTEPSDDLAALHSSSTRRTVLSMDNENVRNGEDISSRIGNKKRASSSVVLNERSRDSDLPADMHPEEILSSMVRDKIERIKLRNRNKDGRRLAHKGTPTMESMSQRVAKLRNKNKNEDTKSTTQSSSPGIGKFFSQRLRNEQPSLEDAILPPPDLASKRKSEGTATSRFYFPAMRGGSESFSSAQTATGVRQRDRGFKPASSEFEDSSVTVRDQPSQQYFSSYYDYVRSLFLNGQISDPFFINSTWVQPPILTVKFMRSSPRVDWAAANNPTTSQSFAVTLDNLLGPFVLAPGDNDGSSIPDPDDKLPVWSFSICAPRRDPLFDGHYFLPCRDSIDQKAINLSASMPVGQKKSALVTTSKVRRMATSSSELAMADRMSSIVNARNKKASKYFKDLASKSYRSSGTPVKGSLPSRRGFGAQAIDGDADRLFTPFGIFDTADDAVIDMYIHQLFSTTNSKSPQFSDLFYQDSIYIWHIQVKFDLDTNGLATVTVEVDNQVRRKSSSFQTIFFLLMVLLLFAVWDAVLRVRGLRSILMLKRMIRKRLESLRREQVRRAWVKAREHEETSFGAIGALESLAKRSNRDDREAFASSHSSGNFNNLSTNLLAAESNAHCIQEQRNTQKARQGGLLSAPGASRIPKNNSEQSLKHLQDGSGVGYGGSEGEENNEHHTLISSKFMNRVTNSNLSAASYQPPPPASKPSSSIRTSIVRAWKDLFGIVSKEDDANFVQEYLSKAVHTHTNAIGVTTTHIHCSHNPNAFVHPITHKILTDFELQQLERKCRKSLKSDVGMSWQLLAIVCDILCAVYVWFAIAQAISLTVSFSAVRMERIILGIAGLFSSVLLVSYLRFFPKFYFMIRATSAALPRVILFYIGVLPIFFAFALFWVTVFGSYSKGQFDSLTRSVATLYCCMFGDNLLPTFQVAMNNDSYEIYFLGAFVTFSFIAFFMFAVLNLTMSIVMDSFDNVKEKYGLQVDDPSQQYLQYGSKGVMAMKAAEQKQIEAVREIREQLGIIAKTLPIINGGKSNRNNRRNKKKGSNLEAGKSTGTNNNTKSASNNNDEEDFVPPVLSVTGPESQSRLREAEDDEAPVISPPESPMLKEADEDEEVDESDVGEDDDEGGTKGRSDFKERYHEFMMEPGIDGDVLNHLEDNYEDEEGDEKHDSEDESSHRNKGGRK